MHERMRHTSQQVVANLKTGTVDNATDATHEDVLIANA